AARRNPHRHRRAGAGRGARRVGGGGAICRRASAVRQADQSLPGDPAQARRDGDRPRSGALPRPLCRVAQGHRPAASQGSRDGQDVCVGSGDGDLRQGGARARVLRLQHGVCGAAPSARHPFHADRRRDERDPQARHRQGAVRVTFNNPLLQRPSRVLPKCVVVVGAGTIGPDIGYYLKSAIPDLTLYLVDVAQPALDRAMQRFTDYTRKAVERGKMSEAEAVRGRDKVQATVDYEVAREADWAIEAATEDLALKRRIFARLEALMRPDALITSNTSSLPAARIFSELQHKGRATVTHFFAPAWRNPVVEVIDTPALDRALLEYLRWMFCMTGKVPLVTADVPCFMLDRVFDNWCNEAAHLLDCA